MKTEKKTATKLATVTGKPGSDDYFGPYWAKIAGARLKQKLDLRIGGLMTERADLEDSVADLIRDANAAIAAARAQFRGDK